MKNNRGYGQKNRAGWKEQYYVVRTAFAKYVPECIKNL